MSKKCMTIIHYGVSNQTRTYEIRFNTRREGKNVTEIITVFHDFNTRPIIRWNGSGNGCSSANTKAFILAMGAALTLLERIETEPITDFTDILDYVHTKARNNYITV